MTLRNLDKAPFPWFGGKSQAATAVWAAIGDVPHYVEPFAGSLAVLLNRPHPANRPYVSETVNDLDGFVVNAWRAMQWHPEATAEAASWPVTEADKQARQIACVKWRTDDTMELLAGSATWCDPIIAGWWLYGVCAQIGAFSGDGPWTADPVSGRIYKQPRESTREPGVSRDRPHLTTNGQGVNHAGTREPGVSRNLPHLTTDGRGVNHAGTREPGVSRLDAVAADPSLWGAEYHDLTMPELVRWFRHLSARLRHVRIVNGDWSRVVTSGAALTLPVRQGNGPVGVFLDPPYDNNERAGGLYGHDCGSVAEGCRDWALTRGHDPQWRIVLAGYDTDHSVLENHGWVAVEWFQDGWLSGGMGNINAGDKTHQQHRERLWLSPHCVTDDQPGQLGLLP